MSGNGDLYDILEFFAKDPNVAREVCTKLEKAGISSVETFAETPLEDIELALNTKDDKEFKCTVNAYFDALAIRNFKDGDAQ